MSPEDRRRLEAWPYGGSTRTFPIGGDRHVRATIFGSGMAECGCQKVPGVLDSSSRRAKSYDLTTDDVPCRHLAELVRSIVDPCRVELERIKAEYAFAGDGGFTAEVEDALRADDERRLSLRETARRLGRSDEEWRALAADAIRSFG